MQRNTKLWPIQGKTKQETENVLERTQASDLIDRDCKVTIINLFTEQKGGTIIKEAKGVR